MHARRLVCVLLLEFILYSALRGAATQISHMNQSQNSAVRVLVVDDNHLSLTLIANLVRREEVAAVMTAKSGGEALAKFPDFLPHIVFLDIDMDGLDGFQTMSAIKELGIPTRIVMVSATATPDRVKSSREGGATGFLVKPVSQKRIGDSIQECLRRNGDDADMVVLS